MDQIKPFDKGSGQGNRAKDAVSSFFEAFEGDAVGVEVDAASGDRQHFRDPRTAKGQHFAKGAQFSFFFLSGFEKGIALGFGEVFAIARLVVKIIRHGCSLVPCAVWQPHRAG